MGYIRVITYLPTIYEKTPGTSQPPETSKKTHSTDFWNFPMDRIWDAHQPLNIYLLILGFQVVTKGGNESQSYPQSEKKAQLSELSWLENGWGK